MPMSRSSAALKSAVAPQLRPANVLCGALGHSMLDQGNGNFGTAPNTDVQQGIGAFPWWVSVLSKGQFVMDRQSWLGAISGTTTQQMINGGQLAAAVASRASIIFIWATTNDRAAGFSLDDGSTVPGIGGAGTSTIPNVKFIIATLLAAGKFVVLLTDPPRGNATLPSPRLANPQLLYHVACRNVFIQQIAKLYGGQVAVIDTWPFFVDNISGQESDALNARVRDGLHPGTLGSFPLAKQVLSVLQGFGLPLRSVPVLCKPDTYDATVNPRGAINATRLGGLNSAAASLPTAQGGVTYAGARPSGFGIAAGTAAQAGTLTVTMTRNATSPQTGETDWFEIAVAGTTAANAGPVIQLTSVLQAAELANLAAGDKITCFGEFQVDSAGVGLNGFALSLQRTTPTLTEQFDLGFADSSTGVLNTILAAQAIAGFHDGEGQSITIDKTETQVQFIWTMRLAESASPNFKVRIRNNAVRKVIDGLITSSVSGNYTVVPATDLGITLVQTSGSASQFTLPAPTAGQVGRSLTVTQGSDGQILFAGASGITVTNASSNTRSGGKGTSVILTAASTTTWTLTGTTAP